MPVYLPRSPAVAVAISLRFPLMASAQASPRSAADDDDDRGDDPMRVECGSGDLVSIDAPWAVTALWPHADIVWGTLDYDNIVWATWDSGNIVWGTTLPAGGVF
jgi:hypothetical protein